MEQPELYKAVLVFHLQPGQADEELRRSKEANSFPNLLAKQPGFIALELIKINEEKTMSVQTWQTEKDWWTALETVKQLSGRPAADQPKENILVSRDFLGGTIRANILSGQE